MPDDLANPAAQSAARAGPPSRLSAAVAVVRRHYRWFLVLTVVAAALFIAAPMLLAPRIAAYPVTRQDLVATVVASGRVQTPFRAQIGSQITGTVASVPVDEGQTVKKGQILVTLEAGDLSAAVRQAAAAVDEAQAHLAQLRTVALPSAREARVQSSANLANLRVGYQRMKTLLAQDSIARTTFDDAERNLAVAEAQDRTAQLQVQTNSPGGSDVVLAETALAAAQANLAAAQAKLGYAVIRAPSDGVLISRDVERGDVVAPGKVLMALSPVADTQIVINVDEKNLSRLAVGQPALASADAFADRRFPARVVYINPGIDASTAAVEVKLLAPAPPSYLRQDMTVSVDIEVARRPRALSIPAVAVRNVGGRPFVLKADHGRAVRVPVRLGVRGPLAVEILDGLQEGDLIIPATAKARAGQRVWAYRHD